jgi:hypothetical protein
LRRNLAALNPYPGEDHRVNPFGGAHERYIRPNTCE